MKTINLCLVLLGILAISHPVAAEFYKYVDEDGNTLYTDDLSKVPKDQREKLTSYEEVLPTPDDGAERAKAARAKQMEALNQSRDALGERKAELDREYQEMVRERADLEAQKANAVTDEEVAAYNKRVTAFNEKMRAFEEKRKALEAEVEEFRKQQAEASADR